MSNVNPTTPGFTNMPVPTTPTSPQNLNPTSLFSPQDIDGDTPPNTPTSPKNSSGGGFFDDFMSIVNGILKGDGSAANKGLMGIYNQEQEQYEKKAAEEKKAQGEQEVKSAMPQSKSDAAAKLGDASDFWDNNPNPDKNVVTLDYVKEVANSNPNDGKYSAETIAAAKYVSQSESTKGELDGATTKEGPLSQDKQYGKWDFQKVGQKPATPEEAPVPKDEPAAPSGSERESRAGHGARSGQRTQPPL